MEKVFLAEYTDGTKHVLPNADDVDNSRYVTGEVLPIDDKRLKEKGVIWAETLVKLVGQLGPKE